MSDSDRQTVLKLKQNTGIDGGYEIYVKADNKEEAENLFNHAYDKKQGED